MDKRLHLLESFSAHGSDGKSDQVHGYEHLVRTDAVPDPQGQWEPTGLVEYKLADCHRIRVDHDGMMTLPDSGVTLQRMPAATTG